MRTPKLSKLTPQVVIDKIVEQKELSVMHMREMLQYLAGYSIFLSTLIGVFGVRHIYSPLGYWFGFIYAYFGIPLIDVVMGEDSNNPTYEESRELSKNMMFTLLLFMYLPIQLVFLLFTLRHVVNNYESMSWFEFIGLIVSTGSTVSGMGFNIAHELFHKINSPIEQIAGIALLFQGMYSHFYIEHIWGHHKHVGTEFDPASCKRGETIYTYVPRSILLGYIDSWKIELARLKRRNEHWCTFHNRMITFTLIQLMLCYLVQLVFGWRGLLFYFLESLCAIIILEAVNYVEHYGLWRRKNPDGTYEQVNVLHSWNAPQYFSNCVLFKLQRHSDHHAYPMKRYQVLCSHEASPKLPYSYPMLLLIVTIPPLFFRIVHPILDDLERRIQLEEKMKDVKVECSAKPIESIQGKDSEKECKVD